MVELTEAQRRELASLRRRYQAELYEKMGAIAEAAGAFREGTWDRAQVQSLYGLTHRLAGSAAIYGFAEISRAAQALEGFTLGLLEGSATTGSGSQLPGLVATLTEALQRGSARRGPGSFRRPRPTADAGRRPR